jgi:hypothetical protein
MSNKSPGWGRHHHRQPPTPPVVPPPVVPPPVVPPPVVSPPTTTQTGVPTPPTGYTQRYSHNFVTQGMGDWVTQGGNNAPVKLSQAKGAQFGLGIELTTQSQWTEIISKNAVVTANCFVQALLYVPLTSGGVVGNWPGWWTTGPNWPEDGEIDIFEGIRGSLTLSTHYGTIDPSTNYASENQQAPVAPAHTGGWLTVTLLRTNQQVTVWYGARKVGPIPAPFTANHELIFQNQSYSTSVCANCFGPLLVPSTTWLSKVSVYSK